MMQPSCNFWNKLAWNPRIARAGCKASSRYGRNIAMLLDGCSTSHQICRTRHTRATSPKRAAMQFAMRTQSCMKPVMESYPLGFALVFFDVPREIQICIEHGNPDQSKDPTFSRKQYCSSRQKPILGFTIWFKTF